MAMCMAKEREMPNCNVTLNATPLQVCTTIKHLGILLNYDLSQRKDINKANSLEKLTMPYQSLNTWAALSNVN